MLNFFYNTLYQVVKQILFEHLIMGSLLSLKLAYFNTNKLGVNKFYIQGPRRWHRGLELMLCMLLPQGRSLALCGSLDITENNPKINNNNNKKPTEVVTDISRQFVPPTFLLQETVSSLPNVTQCGSDRLLSSYSRRSLTTAEPGRTIISLILFLNYYLEGELLGHSQGAQDLTPGSVIWDSLLVGLRELYGVLGIKSRSAMCKASCQPGPSCPLPCSLHLY